MPALRVNITDKNSNRIAMDRYLQSTLPNLFHLSSLQFSFV
jgi:hypothetical protein